MPTPPISEDRSRRYKSALEECLREGYAPYRRSGGRGSSVEEAARRLVRDGHETGLQRQVSNRIQRWLKTQERLARLGNEHQSPDWSLYAAPGKPAAAIPAQRVERWLLTSAQDDTDVHPRFWANLRAYAGYINARIVVAPFTYQKALFEDHRTRTGVFRPEIRDHIRFDPFDCGDVLFAAELNILPTAERPLQGLLTYGRGRTVVFGHAKQALESVPVPIDAAPVQALTTGCCTVPNYIEKKAGQKARFHHIIGAVIVEATANGTWHRHISAQQDGTFYDLDVRVSDGGCTAGHRVEAVTLGDIHAPYFDAAVSDMLWGRRADSLIESLRPKLAVCHDLTDFKPINRHERDNPFAKVAVHAAGEADLRDHLAASVRVLRDIEREWCTPVVVNSNHHDWLARWLERGEARMDPVNALLYHRLAADQIEAIQDGDEDFDCYRHALAMQDARGLDGVRYVPSGSGLVIDGVQIGQHGHKGPDGARGTASTLSRIGMKQTDGHGHGPSILHGHYRAGITCRRDQVYNRGGPTTWAHAHVVQYLNGKRALIFQNEGTGRWRS